jgi:AraC-like DNA-binding protein
MPFNRSSDPLSDACSSLEVADLKTGKLHMEGAWAMSVPASDSALFCASLRGTHWVSIQGDAPVRVDEGDCYLIASVPWLRLSSGPLPGFDESGVAAIQGGTDLSRSSGLASQSEGSGVSLIGARIVFDCMQASHLLKLLPPWIRVPANTEQARSLRSMLHVLESEAGAPGPGAEVMINHLAHILLVQALRAHLDSGERADGWLGALADSKIGAAVALMHSERSRRWTVAELAANVGMSRSSFALKFKALVGRTPLDYWLQLRMRHARRMLRNSRQPVSSVAFAFGYESEKTFAAAFKRVMSHPPSTYRGVGPRAEPDSTPTARSAPVDRAVLRAPSADVGHPASRQHAA